MAVYTQIPTTTFKQLQLNAGIITTSFTPGSATLDPSSIMGATTGGISFTATPSYTDFGEDIDNCPKNMKELKRLESWEVTLSGTFVTVSADLAKTLVGAGDKASGDATKVVPRNDLTEADFADVWFVGDYSDVNTGKSAGFLAIHVLNALSTGGFQLTTSDKAKGQFAFEFTGHYSMDKQNTPPFEVYVKAGTASSTEAMEGGTPVAVSDEAVADEAATQSAKKSSK